MEGCYNPSFFMRICNICGEGKPLTEYYKVNKNRNHYHGKCKKCYIKKEQERYDPDKNRNNQLKRLYGISLNEYNQILEEQGGLCKICGTDNPKGRKTGRGNVTSLYVDHCHNTGKVRGLLCNTCNRAMGYIGEDTNTLKSMIEYLGG